MREKERKQKNGMSGKSLEQSPNFRSRNEYIGWPVR